MESILRNVFYLKYQPNGGGALAQTPHHLQNPKWPPGGPKMADRVLKGVNH